jgi:WD40 repeat protein
LQQDPKSYVLQKIKEGDLLAVENSIKNNISPETQASIKHAIIEQNLLTLQNMFGALAPKEISVDVGNIGPFALGTDNDTAAFGAYVGVYLLKLKSGKLTKLTQEMTIFQAISVALSSDNKKVLAAADNKPNASLWDVESTSLSFYELETKELVTAVALSPDGKQALTGSANGRLLLWNLMSYTIIKELKPQHTKGIISIAFSPNGRYALSASESEVALWDFQLSEVKKVKSNHQIFSVALDPRGKQTFLVGRPDGIYLYDPEVNSDRLIFSLEKELPPKSIAYSPDGNYVLVGYQWGDIYLLKFNKDQLTPIITIERTARLVTYSHDGTFIIAIFNNIIRQWYVGYLTGAISLENIVLITVIALGNAVKIGKNSSWYDQFQQLPNYVQDGLKSKYKLTIVD